MKLFIKKKSVLYGVNDAAAAITDLKLVNTLREGSFLIGFDNGCVVNADGTITAIAGAPAPEKAFIYGKTKGGLSVSAPIFVGKSKILAPLKTTAPAAKVVTFNVTKPGTIADSHSGVRIVDTSKHLYDNTRTNDYTIYVESITTQAQLDALKDKIATSPLVASATVAASVITITFKAGLNPQVLGLGVFERTVATVTTPLTLGNAISSDEMARFAIDCSPFDGNRDTSINGIIGTFPKDYGVEDYRYLVYGFEINTGVYSTGKTDMGQYGAVNYIAIPEGDLASAANEGFGDIFKAMITGVGADSGATGADAADPGPAGN
jgi:hypothetical protein